MNAQKNDIVSRNIDEIEEGGDNDQSINGSSSHHQDHLLWETEEVPDTSVFSNLKWILTNDSAKCDQIVSFLESKMDDKRCVGLDIEYDPTFYKGQRNRTALLQLAVHTGHCLLLQVIKMKSLPPGLVKLLTDPTILKLGVGIWNDKSRIQADFRVTVESICELRSIAPRTQTPIQGLAALSKEYLNADLCKSKKLTLSKWSNDLSLRKRAYAARDAYVAVLLAPELTAKKLQIQKDSVTQEDILAARTLKAQRKKNKKKKRKEKGKQQDKLGIQPSKSENGAPDSL